MPKLLFIGSTVADVIVHIPQLPQTGQDLHITDQQVSLGGCAYNAFHAASLTGLCACTLLSPEGTGVWGDWVRGALAQRGIVSAAPPVDEPNGCCYCLVETGGERTFLCQHGAEYHFRRDWVAAVRPDAFDGAYLCGLEVEETTGEEILSALEAAPPRQLFFAPGPRIRLLDPQRLARLHALHPVYHLNAEEALAFTGAPDVPQAAAHLHALTGSDVIITLGSDGAYALSADFTGIVPGFSAKVVDTIGAGDSHVGTLMAARTAGYSMPRALRLANRMSAAVVGCSGAELPEAVYQQQVKEELTHDQH